MDHLEILNLYTTHMRRDAVVPGMSTHKLRDVTRYVDLKGLEGLVMWHEFDEAKAVRIVERELAYFTKAAKEFNWKIYSGDEPEKLGVLLEKGGMQAGPVSTLMLGEAILVAKLKRDKSMTIRSIGPQQIDDLYAVWEGVWPGENDGWVAILRDALERTPELLQVLVAYDNEKPVAAGYIVLDHRKTFAYMGGGAALPSHRGRGFYRLLVAERARIAQANGTQFLAVEARPDLVPILSRLGFEALTELRFYKRVKK